ncbi:DUF2515 family protein [Bacillaceae bacterium S4-13-58]
MTIRDLELIENMKGHTAEYNLNNITRTMSYQDFFFKHPEMRWSFLASMVSRNAGWNMTDLRIDPLRSLLSKKHSNRLFMTYERANWLIFKDAYPQLLIYEKSKEKGEPLFHLLPYLSISTFMMNEWNYFWKNGDKNRLVYALIVNEQMVIQGPVIEQSYYFTQIFHTLPYLIQDFLQLSSVLFPTLTGELYGQNVTHFTNPYKRIKLGKRLYHLLFYPSLKNEFIRFAKEQPHKGTRRDYFKFQDINHRLPYSDYLQNIYPDITHDDTVQIDWNKWLDPPSRWSAPEKVSLSDDISQSMVKKRILLNKLAKTKIMSAIN